MRLAGKTATITGAAGDIGQASARRFAAEGARLTLIDRDAEGLADLSRSLGPSHSTVVADVTSEEALNSAAKRVTAQIGMPDILFVNAGIEQSHTPIFDMEKEAFDRVIAVNLGGAFLTAKHFLPIVADHGSVIFTSSIAGLMGIPAYSAYSAAKAGLVGLMRSAALDVANRHIRCNTIHPGPVRSKMLARSAAEATGGCDVDGFLTAMAGMARMARLVEPNDVAALALFLASDESAMISSQAIAVDGGVV
jgi:NAD(P)-dependent dehydrogenase (short-subunit alcohol dehydrogenase family)